jgi:replicative DNA helicase
MELNIPIVVLAQLNRASDMRGGDKKPKLSDLRDSGSIEQDADVVMFLNSDFKNGILENNQGESTEYERDLIVAKYRNGQTKDIKLGFEPTKMRLYDLEDSGHIEMVEIKKEPKQLDF